MRLNDPIHQTNYINYVKSLPLDIKTITLILQNSKIKNNPVFYLEYASLFGNSFAFRNAKKRIILLNIAGYLCYNYSLILDSSLDKEVKHVSIMLADIFLEESIKILTNLFGLDNKFWLLWNMRKQEVFKASKHGKEMFRQKNVSIKNYEELCDSKSAFGKVAIDSLFILSNETNLKHYEKLLKSHKLFSVGFQINDDIEDMIDDYENEEFNFAYYKFIVEKNEKVNDIREAKKMLYISGEATKLYELALLYFKKSFKIAKELGKNTWLDAIEGKIKETESVINSIEEYLTVIKTKVSLIENAVKKNTFDYIFNKQTIIEKGLDYLVKEWENDYPEVKHIMVLSMQDDFDNENSLHVADIFQRGIITTNLIDIRDNYSINLSQIINFEIDYLVSNRNKDYIGCWSYFPTVKEIAPDADDLGQMMQVLIKSGNNSLVEDYCNLGIKVLLNDCYNNKTGGIETWIIPKKNLSKKQKAQKIFNDTKWGSGPDIDVMANFLYALSLNDYKTYSDIIKKGTEYIYSKIENGNFWNSRWYYGVYYGTMICVRLIVELIKHNKKVETFYNGVLNKIMNYIINTQNEDGGWAINSQANSDPLNTSFAINILRYIRPLKHDKLVKKGIDYLIKSQNNDGSWDAIHFIKPKINEPYKSKTITTSYVVNTLTLPNARKGKQ